MLKTGAQQFVFPPHSKIRILAETRSAVFRVGADGQPTELLAAGDRELVFRTAGEEIDGLIHVPKGEHWSIEVTDRLALEKLDNTPVEIPEDARKPETMQAKLERMLHSMVVERYGRDSDEVQSLEEFNDFGPEEDGVAMSGYEVTEMEPVEPPAPDDPPAVAPPDTPPDGEGVPPPGSEEK